MKAAVKKAVKVTGDAAYILLNAIVVTTDVFPPLKSAASGALLIVDLVKGFKVYEEEWRSFGVFVQEIVACVICLIPDAAKLHTGLERSVRKLTSTLSAIEDEIKKLHSKNAISRGFHFVAEGGKINAWRTDLNDSLKLFHVSASLNSGDLLQNMLKEEDIERIVEGAVGKFRGEIVSNVAIHAALKSLVCAEGASWRPEMGCLPGTRTALLDEIWDWVYDGEPDDKAEILLLSNVAGSGKTAMAHSLAQRCRVNGLLGSTFFFDHAISGRNGPQKLFVTIARDLASLSKAFADHLGTILETEPSLATSLSQTRQFEQLILEPVRLHLAHRRLVLVIDALDEGADEQTLEILQERIPELPGTFRIFLTSRPVDDVAFHLFEEAHVRHKTFALDQDVNKADITLYVEKELNKIATKRKLTKKWPTPQIIADLASRAEGLFIWASTVCNYLASCTVPDKKLKALLDSPVSTGPVETKMAILYSEILNTCPWDDEDFVSNYQVVVGAIVVLKRPLTSSAIQSLHRSPDDLDVDEVLGRISSLVTGTVDTSQPVRFLHLSFREFLTSTKDERFHINEAEHNERIASLCLRVLAKELKSDELLGTGYIHDRLEAQGVPEIDCSKLPEELRYASDFWPEHVTALAATSEELLDELRAVLNNHIVKWLEISTCTGPFQTLDRFREWFKDKGKGQPPVMELDTIKVYVDALFYLSTRLSFMDRLEEGLRASREAIQLSRELAADQPDEYDDQLVVSLEDLSKLLAQIGRPDDTVHKVASEATALNDLSETLAEQNRPMDALKAVTESAKLYRGLAADRPAAFKFPLAASLNTLAIRLHDIDQTQDGIACINECIAIYRTLAVERPAVRAPLADALDTLAYCLTDSGDHEAGLVAIRESIELDHAVDFNRISSIKYRLTLAKCLSRQRDKEAALIAWQRYGELRKHLVVNNRPSNDAELIKYLSQLAAIMAKEGWIEESEDIESEIKTLSK